MTVDAELGKVLFHQAPPKEQKGPDLDFAAELLKKEAERREALFRQGTEDQKNQSDLLERKFRKRSRRPRTSPRRSRCGILTWTSRPRDGLAPV